MKTITGAVCIFAIAIPGVGVMRAQKTEPATHVTADQIQSFIAALPRGRTSDNPIRTVDAGGYRVGVFGVFRPRANPQEAILHETSVTEIIYILEGSGTLMTGGTIPGSQRVQTPNGYQNQRGSKIEGGTSKQAGKGDVIIIPGHTPHWWVDIASDLSYIVYRPDPDGRTLVLK